MSYGFHSVAKATGFFGWRGAFDIDEHANRTYETNFGHRPIPIDLSGDIESTIKSELRRNGRKAGTPLVVIGCAPCQGFSSHRKKDKRKDGRNSLVARFAEIAVSLNPCLIIMENVPDLLAKKHWEHFLRFKAVVEGAGYTINADIINMANFGVPQERFRTVVLASKVFEPLLPLPLFDPSRFKTVRDAIAHLPVLDPRGGADPYDPMHRTSMHRSETIGILAQVPKNGGSRPRGVGPKCLDKVQGFFDVYGRLSWDKPAITITARCRTPSCGRFAHPEQDRGLSIREAALLQGFPPDFRFEGPFDDCYKQVGNAVPPAFSLVLACHLRDLLSGRNPTGRRGMLSFESPNFQSYSALIAHHKARAAGSRASS
jgi:DNA (cytosine-5)-methyltransferase 1